MSYATNKVVKSAGAAGLVPYLAHADRSGLPRARTTAAYLSGKVAETISLCLLVAAALVAGRDQRQPARRRAVRRDRVRDLRGGRGRRARAHRQPPVAGRLHRRTIAAAPGASPDAVRTSRTRRRGVRRSRARVRDGPTARRLAGHVRAARHRGVRQAARLRRALPRAHRHGDPPRPGDDAPRVHAHDHGLAHRSAPGRHRRGRRIARRAADRQRRARRRRRPVP